MGKITEKVDRLERALMELIEAQRKTELGLQEFQRQVELGFQEIREMQRQAELEVKEIREMQRQAELEMRELREMHRRAELEIEKLWELHRQTELGLRRLKEDMKTFREEMKAFREEMNREVKRVNKQWGELANKMGTIVEDIVFPATRPVIRKYFECDPEVLMMNVERKRKGEKEEYDVIAVCKDKVFIVEVKSSIRHESVKQIKEKAGRFFRFFPEYEGRELVLILASINIKKDVLNLLTKEGIYGMAFREWEYMDILNFDEITKQRLSG